MRRAWMLVLLAVACDGKNSAGADPALQSCARAPAIPMTAAHYATRESFAKMVVEETARAMLDGQCKSLMGLTRAADVIYSVQCSDNGCDIQIRN